MVYKKASTQLWWILASAVIAFILVFFFIPFIQRAITPLGQAFDELGDCDKDHVNNFRDQCPCLSTKGVESEKLPGCPVTTTKEKSEQDKKECKMFVSKEDATKYVETCDQDDKSKCTIKCNQVQQDATEVPESSGKGVAGNWDVTFGQIKYSDKKGEVAVKNGRLDFDLKVDASTKQEYLSLTIEPSIKNIRSQAIGNDFIISVEICDANKQKCAPLKTKSGTKSSKAWIVNGLEADNKEKTLPKMEFIVGKGDYCDGEGDTSCYLKLTVDAAFNLAEHDEFNNEESVFLSLKNKGFNPYDFKKHQLEAIVDDNSEGESIDKYYSNLEELRVSGKLDKDIPTMYPAAGNCWVIGKDEDPAFDNYGAIIIPQGVIISNLKSKKLIPTIGEPFGDVNGIAALQEYLWKADSKGSLLCKENHWLLCDSAAADKIVEVNNKKFRCTSTQQWE